MIRYLSLLLLVAASFGDERLTNLMESDDQDSDIMEDVENGLSENDRTNILNAHNKYRSEVDPTAANMAEMIWDSNISNLAKDLAEECIFQHGKHENFGQNIAAGFGGYSVDDFIADWDSEKKDYNFKDNICSATPPDSCLHYTQVVWAKSTSVGCAKKLCEKLEIPGIDSWNNAIFFVCNYNPGGNYHDANGVMEKPYINGKPCSKCPMGATTCKNNLCT